jgi:hypothetical protein
MSEEESGPVDVDEAFSVGTVAAETRARQGAMAGAGASGGRIGRRIPILTIIVVAGGLYLLADMFRDFSYWLGAGDARDLGDAAALVTSPEGTPDNQFVTVHGTPKSTQAASVAMRNASTDYLPFAGTDAQLWVGLSRTVPEMPDYGEGAYTGRIQRFSKVEERAHVLQVLRTSDVSTTVDTTPEALLQFLGGGGGDLDLRPEDRVHLVIAEPDATVQLGKSTFRKLADAEALVSGLGYPYLALPRDKQQYHTFVARIPAEQRDAAQTKLRDQLPEGTMGASPSHGAQILPRTRVHKAETRSVTLNGDAISVPAETSGDVSPGYVLAGDKLAERAPEGKSLSFPVSTVTKVRIERPVTIPPGAAVVMVGQAPGGQTMKAILWILLLLVVVAVPLRPWIQERMHRRMADV